MVRIEFEGKACMTHSYNTHRFEDDMAKIDIAAEQVDELKKALSAYTYDDYDHLIQFCDSIATADGVVATLGQSGIRT